MYRIRNWSTHAITCIRRVGRSIRNVQYSKKVFEMSFANQESWWMIYWAITWYLQLMRENENIWEEGYTLYHTHPKNGRYRRRKPYTMLLVVFLFIVRHMQIYMYTYDKCFSIRPLMYKYWYTYSHVIILWILIILIAYIFIKRITNVMFSNKLFFLLKCMLYMHHKQI